MSADDGLYTLKEAARILAERQCNQDGHTLYELNSGEMSAYAIICERCGRKWVPAE